MISHQKYHIKDITQKRQKRLKRKLQTNWYQFSKIPMWILETLYYSKRFSTISEKCADKGKVCPVL